MFLFGTVSQVTVVAHGVLVFHYFASIKDGYKGFLLGFAERNCSIFGMCSLAILV